MTIIAPSILSCDFLNIEPELRAFDSCNNIWLHLDIMDAHFVPNLTFGQPVMKNMHKITSHPLDAHFMVSDPEFFIDTCKDFHLHNFTFHIEATTKPVELLKKGKQFFPSMGISIKPKTPVSSLTDEILKISDLVLVMSVEPGFGGQSFIEESYNKIKELENLRKTRGYHYQIQVDGGVSDQNAGKLIECGTDNLVAGSYIFNANQQKYPQMIDSLRQKNH
ncbi:MAG: ribulose-phosphate 3-epimerase [Bacteriovoracaceae bacterium]|nr:ribulose-phosphate 3-epimerase [Bacteriovoracaceae bacterium]